MIVSLVSQIAVDEIFPNKDPLYLVWLWRNAIEVWGMALANAPATIGGLVMLTLLLAILLFSKHFNIAVATPSVTLSKWVGTLPGFRHIRKWLGEKAMRKEVRAAQGDEWIDEIIEITESKVAAEQWTRTQAKEWYATFSKSFPVLRYAATHDDTDGDLKAVIRERRLNEHRDVNGAIIPVPVP